MWSGRVILELKAEGALRVRGLGLRWEVVWSPGECIGGIQGRPESALGCSGRQGPGRC